MSRPGSPSGVLVVDKPQGPTSHDVVAVVRRLLGRAKVGHTGTLDPMATGVLPLVLGEATKLSRYLMGGDKAYRATVRLGTTTDTLDAEGRVLTERPVTVTAAAIEAALQAFRGPFLQTPPMYSAKKIEGQKLYRLARAGQSVTREAKPVVVHALRVVAVALPEVVLEISCSAGTYVRALAHDLGEALGCGAHLAALRRTRAGPFGEGDAVGLPLALAGRSAAGKGGDAGQPRPEPPPRPAPPGPEVAGALLAHLRPLGTALGDLPRLTLPTPLARRVAAGYQLRVGDLAGRDDPLVAEQAVALCDGQGRLVAVGRALVGRDGLATAAPEQAAVRTERVLAVA